MKIIEKKVKTIYLGLDTDCVERVYRDFRVLHQQWYRCKDDDF